MEVINLRNESKEQMKKAKQTKNQHKTATKPGYGDKKLAGPDRPAE